MDQDTVFFVGTYTEPILFGTGEVLDGKGQGLYLCTFSDGQIAVHQTLPMRNPSFFCACTETGKLYAVNETKEYRGAFGGGVTQVSLRDGRLHADATLGTGGTDPCHIALAPNGRFLSVANFASGSVSVFPLDAAGNLTGGRTQFQHEGHSVHPVRQRGPHAHATVFSARDGLLFVPDLGLDLVKAYRYEGDTVTPAPEYDFGVPAGSGPRSGVFRPDGRVLYLIQELGSRVLSFRCDGGRMTLIDSADTLPEEADRAANICSDLHLTPDGRYLYASNRGHDSICCFRTGEDGRMALQQRIPCGGRTPRNFAITPSGSHLLVGNQDSDTITVFSIDRDGWLTQTGQYPFPTPVCIRFCRGFEAGIRH